MQRAYSHKPPPNSRAGVSPARDGHLAQGGELEGETPWGQARRLPYYSNRQENTLARAVSLATASPLRATRAISTKTQQKKVTNV